MSFSIKRNRSQIRDSGSEPHAGSNGGEVRRSQPVPIPSRSQRMRHGPGPTSVSPLNRLPLPKKSSSLLSAGFRGEVLSRESARTIDISGREHDVNGSEISVVESCVSAVKASSYNANVLTKLPDALLFACCEYLETQELLKMLRLCKSVYSKVSNDTIWKRKYASTWQGISLPFLHGVLYKINHPKMMAKSPVRRPSTALSRSPKSPSLGSRQPKKKRSKEVRSVVVLEGDEDANTSSELSDDNDGACYPRECGVLVPNVTLKLQDGDEPKTLETPEEADPFCRDDVLYPQNTKTWRRIYREKVGLNARWKSGECTMQVLPHNGSVKCMVFYGPGRNMRVHSEEGHAVDDNLYDRYVNNGAHSTIISGTTAGEVSLFSTQGNGDGSNRFRMQASAKLSKRGIASLAGHAVGTTDFSVVVGTHENQLLLVNFELAATDDLLPPIATHNVESRTRLNSTPLSLCSSGSDTVCVGTFDGLVQVFDVSSESVVRTYAGHTSEVRSMEFFPHLHPRNAYASAGQDGHVALWDLRVNRNVVRNLNAQGESKGAINTVRWYSETELLTAGADGRIHRWCLRTMTHRGVLQSTLDVKESPIRSLDVDRTECDRIVTGHENGSCTVWSGEGPVHVCYGHRVSVYSVACNFNMLCSGSHKALMVRDYSCDETK